MYVFLYTYRLSMGSYPTANSIVYLLVYKCTFTYMYFTVQVMHMLEDPDVALDLRALNGGQKTKEDTFWDKVQRFLQEGVGLAAEE